MAGTGEADSHELLRLLTGPWLARAVATAVELGVVDELGEGPAAPADLAHRLKLDPGHLSRLLRALAATAVLHEHGGRYELTEAGEFLHRRHPSGMRDLALLYDSEFFTRAWSGLAESVRTGEPAFGQVHGTDVFTHLGEHSDDASRYAAGMSAGSRFATGIPAVYDFRGAERVVDLGGGDGGVLAAVLAHTPGAHGLLYERPAALPAARRRLAPYVEQGRCELVEGDFFDSVPAGADVYLLCRVLHNWDNAACTRLLGHCAQAMGPRARLLIAERVLPDSGHPPLSLAYDLLMMVMTQGAERTAHEYESLLRRTGLHTRDVRDLPMEMRLLVAARV